MIKKYGYDKLKIQLKIENIDAFIFDFDGVLTDNLVSIDQAGNEFVSCSRADGLAFDIFRELNIPTFILSTESNPVVAARGRKLKVPVIQSVINKEEALRKLVKENGYSFEKIFYVGNDLNDYNAMSLCGFSACPADSHKVIQDLSSFLLSTDGGKGVVREILEEIFEINFLEIL